MKRLNAVDHVLLIVSSVFLEAGIIIAAYEAIGHQFCRRDGFLMTAISTGPVLGYLISATQRRR